MATMEPKQLAEQLSAYIDGELMAEEREDVERILKDDADARRILDELRQSIEALSSLPRHAAPDSIAEDVQFHVERSALLSDTESSQVESRGRRIFVPAVIAMAAVVGLSVGGLWIMMGEDGIGKNVDNRLAMGPQAESLPYAAKHDLDDLADRRSRVESKEEEGRLRADESGAVSADLNTSDDRFALAATMDQKMRASMPVSSVQTHAFDNEPVRLRIGVQDEKERMTVAANMISYLRRRGAIDLTSSTSLRRDRPLPTQSFYLPGKRGVNFSAGNQGQVLVRVSRSELGELISKLAGDSSRDHRVAMSAGPLSIRGARRVLAVLSGMGERESKDSGASAVGKVADMRNAQGRERADAGGEWLENLFRMSNSAQKANEPRASASEFQRSASKPGDKRRAKTRIAAARRGRRSASNRPASVSAPVESDRSSASNAVGQKKTKAMNRLDAAAVESYITLIVEIAVEKPSHNAASPAGPGKPRSRSSGARGEKVPNG